jgi:hypothetical protein
MVEKKYTVGEIETLAQMAEDGNRDALNTLNHYAQQHGYSDWKNLKDETEQWIEAAKKEFGNIKNDYPVFDLLNRMSNSENSVHRALKNLVFEMADATDMSFDEFLERSRTSLNAENSKLAQDLPPLTSVSQPPAESGRVIQAPTPNVDELELVRKYSLDGKHTIQQIANKTDLSVSTVNRYRKQLGIRRKKQT